MALGSTQPLTDIITRIFPGGYRRPVRMADNLTAFMCRLSRNVGASTSWNSQGLSRPVMGLLYLLPSVVCVIHSVWTASACFKRIWVTAKKKCDQIWACYVFSFIVVYIYIYIYIHVNTIRVDSFDCYIDETAELYFTRILWMNSS
jgi:hypothetical protein